MEKKQKNESLYPWHLAPKWAKYAATDYDGKRWFFEKKPHCNNFEWRISGGKYAEICNPFDGFAETLEERPK
jgi:hypothetical protein